MLRTRTRTGITLLELIAVIVILAMLWGLVFPAMRSARRAFHEREARTEAESLAAAVQLYYNAYGHWPLQNKMPDPDQDIIYGTNLVVSSAVNLLDHAELIRALVPQHGGREHNPLQRTFLEIDANRLRYGCFTDPWSTTNRFTTYIVAVDANGDGWIGTRSGSNDSPVISPIELRDDAQGSPKVHSIPALREPVYVFSWSDSLDQSNRIATAKSP